MIREKTNIKVAFCCFCGILCLANSLNCYAATYSDIQAAKDAARKSFLGSSKLTDTDIDEQTATFFESVDGSVAEDGIVKMTFSNWSSYGIPASEKELKVYREMSASAKESGVIFKNSIVLILDRNKEWVHIQSGQLNGYVESKDLLYGKDAQNKANEVCPEQVLSDKGDTWIMVKPNNKSSIKGYMVQRKLYPIKQEKDAWISIDLDGKGKGYAKDSEVKKVRQVKLGEISGEENTQNRYRKENLTQDERQKLAMIIFCEAGGESFEGQIAVGSVILNRVHSDMFPDKVEDVILQKGQFEPIQIGTYQKVVDNPDKVSDSCYEAADVVIQGRRNVGDALYFGYGDYGVKIGAHWFH